MTRAEKVARISHLQQWGLSHAEIARELGISRSAVRNLIYDPDGAKQMARRKRYGGICQTCGAPTDGSNGRAKAPDFCKACAPDAHRTWTRKNIIVEIQRFAREHGRPPHATDWTGPRSSGYPSSFTVQYVFGSWANGIEAAGFTRPKISHYDRAEARARRLAKAGT